MTRAQLLNNILFWANKPEVEQSIGTFIEMVEAEINRRCRVRRMIARATETVDDEYGAVPSDFLAVRSFHLDGEPRVPLEYLDPDTFNTTRYEYTTSGRPQFYTVEGAEFRYLPSPGESFTANLTYFAKVPALTADDDDNWILANHPDAYLYGALSHAGEFLGGHEGLARWQGRYEAALSSIEASDRSESYGATLQTRSRITV